nr:MAG TPA: hypothetical protein [Caudoviricetes sp.]
MGCCLFLVRRLTRAHPLKIATVPRFLYTNVLLGTGRNLPIHYGTSQIYLYRTENI